MTFENEKKVEKMRLHLMVDVWTGGGGEKEKSG